jgi:subtilisin family serine protease
MRGNTRIIYAPGANPQLEDVGLHGTHMATKIGGPVYGVAKNANVVSVKMPYEIIAYDAVMSIPGFIAALVETGRDIVRYGLQGIAVINISLGCGSITLGNSGQMLILILVTEEDPALIALLESTLEYLIADLRAVVVCSAGNNFVVRKTFAQETNNIYSNNSIGC